MALNGLFCADLPLRNYSLTQLFHQFSFNLYEYLYSTVKHQGPD